MSDEKPFSKSDENPFVQENETKLVSVDANPVVEEIAMPKLSPKVPDNAPSEQSFAQEPQTPSQSEELTNEAIADERETPLPYNETPENEIPPAVETPGNGLLQHLKSIGEANGELLQQLVKDFDVKLKYDAAKQEQIDKLWTGCYGSWGFVLKSFFLVSGN